MGEYISALGCLNVLENIHCKPVWNFFSVCKAEDAHRKFRLVPAVCILLVFIPFIDPNLLAARRNILSVCHIFIAL